MDDYIAGLLIIGLLLLTVTWGAKWIHRIPLSFAIIYLFIGVLLGPYGVGLIELQPDAEFIKRASEFVVIVSLYGSGLKMNRPLRVPLWNSTIRLLGLLMPLSILAVAMAGHWLLGLSWASALLLGAILAPTDPVLASEVQLEHPRDSSELRFGLTSEGGLNDALAFPFVYFGIYWIDKPNIDTWFQQWVWVDLIWAIGVALVMGIVMAKLVVRVNAWVRSARGLDETISDLGAIGVLLLTYALTEVVNGYGFLAVFITGLMLQKRGQYPEQRASQLQFITQIEKLLEVGAILLLGSLLRLDQIREFGWQALLMAGLLLFVIRPVGAWISTLGSGLPAKTRWLFGWFGIRGIGSIYYLSYAVSEGLPGETTAILRWITYITIVVSILLHGVTARPLIDWHDGEGRDRKPV